jgi:hypothetical protein
MEARDRRLGEGKLEMSVLCAPKHRDVAVSWLTLPGVKPAPNDAAKWFRWLALALLGGYLLFCHGCHGDEDDELFAGRGVSCAGRFSQTITLSRQAG